MLNKDTHTDDSSINLSQALVPDKEFSDLVATKYDEFNLAKTDPMYDESSCYFNLNLNAENSTTNNYVKSGVFENAGQVNAFNSSFGKR